MFLFKHWKRGLSNASIYGFWRNMIQGCNGGGHNITVCGEWTDFSRFLKDTNEKYDKNNDVKYYPDGVKEEQVNCRSGNIFIDVKGVRYTVAQFAEKFHLDAKQLYAKLNQKRNEDRPKQMRFF